MATATTNHFPVPVAIITGAGSGIGRSLAHMLANEGMKLVLVGRRGDALARVQSELAAGTESVCAPMDVADPASAHAMITTALGRFGRVDVLVNNAAYAPLLPISETRADLIQQVYMTNAVGPACAIASAWRVFQRQHATKRMSAIGHCIVNVSTLGTTDPFPGFFAYASSKASMNVMAKSCAREGRDIGVRAFAVAPGAVETPMLRAIFSTEQIPGDKCLQPEEVASEIVACITGERDEKNGQTIFLRPTEASA